MQWRKHKLFLDLIALELTLSLSSPGAIYTPIQVDTRDAQQMEGWGHKVGLGRPGEPSEVATSFIFLASADASLYCEWSNPPEVTMPTFPPLGLFSNPTSTSRWADTVLLSSWRLNGQLGWTSKGLRWNSYTKAPAN